MTTPLYLIYIAVFGLCLFCLVIFMTGPAFSAGLSVHGRYPRKAVSVFLFVCAVLMIVIKVIDIAGKTILQRGGLTPYDVFYVLDLAVIFPAMILTAVLN